MIMAPSIVVSISCLIFCLFAFLYFRMFIVKRTGFEGIIKEVRDEVSRLIQRIDETADKDISLIEDKEKSLRTLLDETDRRMAALNRELARRENAEDTYRKLGRFSIIEQSTIEKSTIEQSNPTLTPPLPQEASSKETYTTEDKSQENQLRDLVRSGFSPQIIASRLGISIAEAEFAVALQERRDS